MNIYRIEFRTKDIIENVGTAIVHRWQIIIADSASEAIAKLEKHYPNIEKGMEIHQR